MSDDPGLRVTGGTPTDEETAAIAAVFTLAALERAASTAPLDEQPRPDGWLRSARNLRGPLPRGGAWNAF